MIFFFFLKVKLSFIFNILSLFWALSAICVCSIMLGVISSPIHTVTYNNILLLLVTKYIHFFYRTPEYILTLKRYRFFCWLCPSSKQMLWLINCTWFESIFMFCSIPCTLGWWWCCACCLDLSWFWLLFCSTGAVKRCADLILIPW